MPHRHRAFLAAILVSVAVLAAASATGVRAQPRRVSDDGVEILRQLIREVELKHRVLLRSRGGDGSMEAG